MMRKFLCASAVCLGLWAPVALAQGGRAGGEGQTVILEKAPLDHAIAIPKEKLAQYLKDMDAKKLQTLRMIEGGKFNVNIRRITNAETALIHPKTVDVWVVLEGGGTLTTGGKIEKGKIVGGESHTLKVGDVEFIPAGLPHGVSGVNGNITWLNVRWDTDWTADATLGARQCAPARRYPRACGAWTRPGGERVRPDRSFGGHSPREADRVPSGDGGGQFGHAAHDRGRAFQRQHSANQGAVG